MDWSADGASLVAVRAIHFAATMIVAGMLVFRMTVARPDLDSEKDIAGSFRTQTQRGLWLALGVAVLSGAIWLLVEATSMSGLPFREAATADVLSTVANETQFGQVTLIRLGLAIALASCLALGGRTIADWLALATALGLAASLAWTGHAGSTLGAAGDLHLAADGLHLIAAAAWIGGLVSLIPFLATACRNQTVSPARIITERFSTLGMISVATLLLTGTVNTVILVGSVRGLAVTDYGRVLMLKLGLFGVMLGFAAFNRLHLMPRLHLQPSGEHQTELLRRIRRNSIIEIALGLAIIAIVGMLGTMHPAIHMMSNPGP
jgi:putative copper resistance protein D